ncbi:MAG: fatty acyl-AMP ligase [Pseudomonadota bacterium]|nr:fatty acyl-AMP ligase [Pseudomonadota bacterium]
MIPASMPSRYVPAVQRRPAFRLPWTSYVDLVRTRAESQPDRLAVYGLPKLAEVGPRYSWARMDRRIRALAALLQDAGARGEPVVLLQENDPLYLVSFLACAYAGAIAVPMPPLAHARHLARLARVLQDCGATRILTTRDLHARCAPELDAVLPGARWLLADEVGDAAAAAWDDHYPDGSDIAFLQYTSGSTSAPKGVVVRHADLVWQGESFGRAMALGPDDRALCWMPLFHDLGLILGALQPLYTGFPVAITSPAAFVKAPERWLQAVSDHRITVSGGPNFAYDLCADVVDPAGIPGLDLSCWAQALNAAEPVRAGTIDRFVAKFGPYGFRPEAMQPGYGLAEATVGVALTPRGRPHVRRAVDPDALAAGRVVDSRAADARVLVSSGPALPGLALRIVDRETPAGTEGVALPPDTIGEVWTGCDHFPETYWKLDSRDVFDARLRGEGGARRYARTGDLGFVDAAGNLTITGRSKDLVIVAGKNHYPQDVELTVEEASPAVRRNFVAAFGVERGDTEVAVVVAEVRRDATPAEIAAAPAAILRAVAERHELALHDVHLVVQGQVPKTTSGKIQRAKCRELWAERAFRGVA